MWHRRPVAVDAAFVAIVWIVDLALASLVTGNPRTPPQAVVIALTLAVAHYGTVCRCLLLRWQSVGSPAWC